MDPLDDVFATMQVRSALYARLEARAPWGVSLAGGEAARFGMVVRGSCLLEVPGHPPVSLAAGDCYVLVHGTPHVLRDHPQTPTVSCASVVRDRIGGVVELGGSGAAATLLCGWFHFDPEAARPLQDLLPVLLHVRMDEVRAQALQGTLQLLAMETGEPGLGSGLVVSRLADILFVQAVRAHVAAAGSDTGWLGALTDPRIGPALRAMHKDLAHGWTVDSLAEAARLSRSAFALRFRQRVGQAPLDYLTRWRMRKAGLLLREGARGLGEVAGAVGYESEAAFSKAFKRATGVAPGAWRSRGREAAAAGSIAATSE
ncbi:MAG: AraC family transcriptional regulator [Ramlibacter sp.]|nr:AraC family transcriptional regulator [Ramlibacter sp.]